MRRVLSMTALAVLMCSPAFAQQATAVGTGISSSKSRSDSQATAIGGGQGIGTGGNSSVTLNGAPAVQTINGTQTIKNVPSVFAPGLAAAGLETCLGSISAGVGVVGTGATFGSTVPDPKCAARLDARTLWSFGLKKAAIARLCLETDIYRSMPDVCAQYEPGAPAAYDAAAMSGGGPILLIEGKTGNERLCLTYDGPKQRCIIWADSPNPVPHASKKQVMVKPPVMSSSPIPIKKPTEKPAEGKKPLTTDDAQP